MPTQERARRIAASNGEVGEIVSSEHRELGSSLFGSEPWQPIRTRATIAVIGIAAAVVAGVVDLIATWRVVNSYGDGSVSTSELRAVTNFADSLTWPLAIVNLVAGLAFLVWMWRAYTNATFFGGEASQRRTQGWAVFGWIVPVVNFWFPYQMMSDIWRASPPVRVSRTAPIVGCWWAAYLGTSLASVILAFYYREPDTDDLDAVLILSIVGTVLSFVAGVLIIMIINRITAWQNEVRDADAG